MRVVALAIGRGCEQVRERARALEILGGAPRTAQSIASLAPERGEKIEPVDDLAHAAAVGDRAQQHARPVVAPKDPARGGCQLVDEDLGPRQRGAIAQAQRRALACASPSRLVAME